MLKAFVGIASNQGLAVLHPERNETISYVQQCLETGQRSHLWGRVGFWVVLDDTEARLVQALVVGGLCREAMLVLDRSAKEMGRILPNDPRPDLH